MLEPGVDHRQAASRRSRLDAGRGGHAPPGSAERAPGPAAQSPRRPRAATQSPSVMARVLPFGAGGKFAAGFRPAARGRGRACALTDPETTADLALAHAVVEQRHDRTTALRAARRSARDHPVQPGPAVRPKPPGPLPRRWPRVIVASRARIRRAGRAAQRGEAHHGVAQLDVDESAERTCIDRDRHQA